MKKLLLAASALFTMALAFGQESKGLQGTWFVTSQLGYQQTKTGDVKSTNTTILPIVGYFVAPTTAVGIAAGNVGIKAQDATKTLANSQLLVIQPLARKYWNVAGGLFFFGQVAAPIITGKEKISDTKINQFGLTFAGGFDYLVTKHFSVEFSYNLINFSQTTIKPSVGEKTTVTDLSLAHVASVGSEYNSTLAGSMSNAVTPLSFGFKFLF